MLAAAPYKRKHRSTRERIRLFDLHGGVCHICGGKIAVGEAWEIEHDTALALGGGDDDENCKLAHAVCHKDKTRDDVRMIRKADSQRAKHFGAKSRPRAIIDGSKASKWRKPLRGGPAVLRNP